MQPSGERAAAGPRNNRGHMAKRAVHGGLCPLALSGPAPLQNHKQFVLSAHSKHRLSYHFTTAAA